MPTYEYICEKCGHQFDLFQSITAKPLGKCPKELCPRQPWGKGRVKRLMSGGAGFLFKGSGFYITDYRSENYKAGAKKDVPGGSSSGSSATGSTSGEAKTSSPGAGATSTPAPKPGPAPNPSKSS